MTLIMMSSTVMAEVSSVKTRTIRTTKKRIISMSPSIREWMRSERNTEKTNSGES